ncbi:MAG TPA: SUMF1/EgtB/PvdO family nonheme iron enzyme, partial [Candidatus Krumholzibacteria bacterium]|nr:SUMF1/EgtB/PvdO family nonheme iron enzyme [Candidatus Krumholzibacteria bacterium]
RCLEKDAAIRYQSAAQVRDELRELLTETSTDRLIAAKPTSLFATFRKPRVFVPLLAIVVALTAVVIGLSMRSSRTRWARQEALPEIERLIDATPWTGGLGFWQAYALGAEVARYLPDDPVLQQLHARYTAAMTLHTDPPGAKIFARPIAPADSTWMLVGQTPIDTLSFVRGVFAIKIERTGFATTYDLFWNGFYDFEGRRYELKRPDQIPRGMVWVSGQSPRVESDGETEGVHVPGIEHLAPQELGDFFVDRYEVTNKAYKVFVDGGGYADPTFWKQPLVENETTVEWKDAMARFVDKTQRPGPAGWEVGDYPEGADHHPVTGISWYEAAAFAEFAGKNLPTIYHWDRVALTWSSGDIVPLSNLTTDRLVRVGSTKGMNRYGTFDLAGNAREWCANATSRGDRFILGGGWNDPPYGFNDAYAQSPWDRSETNGFRCIRYVGTVDPAALEATVEVPFRDFMNEPAPSDTVFAVYQNQFRYDKKPLNAVVESKLETEDYVREKIVIDAAYGGERMAVYLFLPKKSSPPYQAVVLFPGSGSIHTRSSADLTPAPNAFLVKSGRALLWPVLKSTYERGDEQDTDYPDESNRYKDHVVMWTKDIMRSVDYLETRKDIDSGRLAFLGHSWGAAMSPIVLAVEPRFKVAILGVAGLLFQRSQPEADPMQYIRRVQVPVIMLNGKYDFFFPYETSQVPFYQLLGTPTDHKKLVVHEFGHAIPATDRARESLAWLDKYLGAVR